MRQNDPPTHPPPALKSLIQKVRIKLKNRRKMLKRKKERESR